jgi:hypothetical protein
VQADEATTQVVDLEDFKLLSYEEIHCIFVSSRLVVGGGIETVQTRLRQEKKPRNIS